MYFSDYAVSWKMNKENTLSLTPGVWFNNDMQDSFYKWVGLNHVYSWGHGVSSLLGLQYDETKNKKGEWIDKQYIILGPVYKHAFGDICTLNTQARVFFRTNDEADFDHWRPRIGIERKIGSVVWELADELRFDLTGDRDEFYKNRVFLGGTYQISKLLKINLSYLRESNQANGTWVDSNGVISKLIVTL